MSQRRPKNPSSASIADAQTCALPMLDASGDPAVLQQVLPEIPGGATLAFDWNQEDLETVAPDPEVLSFDDALLAVCGQPNAAETRPPEPSVVKPERRQAIETQPIPDDLPAPVRAFTPVQYLDEADTAPPVRDPIARPAYSTGVVRVRKSFDSADTVLLPGMFDLPAGWEEIAAFTRAGFVDKVTPNEPTRFISSGRVAHCATEPEGRAYRKIAHGTSSEVAVQRVLARRTLPTWMGAVMGALLATLLLTSSFLAVEVLAQRNSETPVADAQPVKKPTPFAISK